MQYEDVRIKSSDVVTCVHELLFDFSIWEIFGALCNGASVCVVPRTMYLSPPDLIKLCDRLGVTVLSQTPAAFAALESDDRLMGNRAARAASAQSILSSHGIQSINAGSWQTVEKALKN